MATLVTAAFANIVNYTYTEPTLVGSDFIVESVRTTYTTGGNYTQVTYANIVGYSFTNQTILSTDVVEGLIDTYVGNAQPQLAFPQPRSANINVSGNILSITSTEVLTGSNSRVAFGVVQLPDVFSNPRDIAPPIPFIVPTTTFAVSTNGAPFTQNTVGPQFWNLG